MLINETKRNVTMILAGPELKETINETLYKSETDQTSESNFNILGFEKEGTAFGNWFTRRATAVSTPFSANGITMFPRI